MCNGGPGASTRTIQPSESCRLTAPVERPRSLMTGGSSGPDEKRCMQRTLLQGRPLHAASAHRLGKRRCAWSLRSQYSRRLQRRLQHESRVSKHGELISSRGTTPATWREVPGTHPTSPPRSIPLHSAQTTADGSAPVLLCAEFSCTLPAGRLLRASAAGMTSSAVI